MNTAAQVRYQPRLDALWRTRLIETPGGEQFDRLTRLAAAYLQAPLTLVTLVDENRLFFKSAAGQSGRAWLAQRQAPLTYSFCPEVIAKKKLVAIPDARKVVPNQNCPLLTEFHAYAYAGVPLITSKGFAIGAFCAIDHRPREWRTDELNILIDLAALAKTEIDVIGYLQEAQENTAAAEQERRLISTLLESTSEGICGLDSDGRCTFINPAGADLFGYRPDELKGRLMQVLMHYSDRGREISDETQWPIVQALKNNVEIRCEEAVFFHRSRTTFPVEYSLSPIRSGGMKGGVITFVDISARKRSEATIRIAEEKYRLIFENSPHGIFQSSADGKFISTNGTLAKIFGYSSAKELMDSVQNIGSDLYINPARRAEYEHKLLSQGHVTEFESQVRRKDGGSVWVSETARAVRFPSGILRYFEGSVEDITARREAQEALRRQNQYLEALHDTTLALMNRLELSDLLETLVQRAADLLGTANGYICMLEPGENHLTIRVGAGIYANHIGDKIARGHGVAGSVWDTGKKHVINNYSSWTGRARTFDGYLLHAVFGAPLMYGTQLVGVLGMAYDKDTRREFGPDEVAVVDRFAELASLVLINARLFAAARQELSERRRAEAALQEAKDAAEVANRSKSMFLANMSHELRTPLNAVIGYSEMLQEEAADLGMEDFIPDLQKIQGAGRHLLALINDILDLSKIEAGKMDVCLEPVEVAKLIGEVASTIEPLIQKNENILRITIDPHAGIMQTDAMKVRQSLLNLLSNASKFTDHGVVMLNVRRDTVADRDWEGDWIEFQVVDTGIGMTSAQMGRLFEAFSQADAATSSKFGGTGLGLALTKRFCKLMGGDVRVESEHGVGSTFTIRLPAAATHSAAAE